MLLTSCKYKKYKKYKRHRRHGSIWRIYRDSRQIFQAIFTNNMYYFLIEMNKVLLDDLFPFLQSLSPVRGRSRNALYLKELKNIKKIKDIKDM